MNNADTIGAAFGLLLGLAAQHGPAVATTAEIASVRPVVAIEKAQAAAKAESQRARASDAEAERVFATEPSGAAAGGRADNAAAEGNARPPEASGDAVASREPGDAGADPHGAAQADLAASKYDPAQHRDPFRPPNLTHNVADSKSGGPRTPLEAYELGQLKLVGIVNNSSDVRAMVEDSAGLGYIISTGTPIGSSGGVVRRIEPRRVLIEEMSTNFYGEKQAKEVVMELPQEDRSP